MAQGTQMKTLALPCYTNHGEAKDAGNTFLVLTDCDPSNALLYRYDSVLDQWILEYDFAAKHPQPANIKLGSGHTLRIGANYIWLLINFKDTSTNKGGFIPIRIPLSDFPALQR